MRNDWSVSFAHLAAASSVMLDISRSCCLCWNVAVLSSPVMFAKQCSPFVKCVIAAATGESPCFFLFCPMLGTDDIVWRNMCAMLARSFPGASRVVFNLWRPPLKC